MPPSTSHSHPLLAGLCLLVLLPFSALRADLVTDWNTQALDYMSSTAQSPFITRDLAMLNIAIYNAGESIRGGYSTYSSGSYSVGAGPAGASLEAAMATAAYEVMRGLYGPNVDFTNLYNSQMSGIAGGQARDEGAQWGASIAASIISWRTNDGADVAAATPYSPVGTVGYWQPTSSSSALLPGWGNVVTFSINGTVGYTSTLPGSSMTNYLASNQYAADFNEVKELGGQFSLSRTADQTHQAYFWNGIQGGVKIPTLWNEIAVNAAATAGLDVFDTARLLAAMNVAMADAGIAAFANSYATQFWRPETAIANGGDAVFDPDGNVNTEGDVFWLPLIKSPSFPEYASVQAAYSAAAAAVLAEFLGDARSFNLGSDIDGNGTIDLTRFFTSFSQAANESAWSGIYAGTQFGTSVTDAQALGANVANQVVSNNFALIPEPAGALLVLLGYGVGLLSRHRRAL